MPAATNKTDLLRVSIKEYEKLSGLLGAIQADKALAKDADDTSIKDVIAHRAHWIDLFFGWYSDGRAGKEVALPAPGYNWGDLKRYNADLRDRQKNLGWDDAKAMLADRHNALIAFIEGKTDAELYGGPMKGGRNNWTAGRWAEAAGPSHYRSASKYIRARLRELQA